jgi:hypothetical protein
MCCVPLMVPGGKPVTELPGLNPRSPVTTVGPVFVTVEPARTAKLSAVRRGTGDAARALLANATATTNASNTIPTPRDLGAAPPTIPAGDAPDTTYPL